MKCITEIRLSIVRMKIQGVHKTHRVKCTTGTRLSIKVNITEIRLSIVSKTGTRLSIKVNITEIRLSIVKMKIQGVPKRLQT